MSKSNNFAASNRKVDSLEPLRPRKLANQPFINAMLLE